MRRVAAILLVVLLLAGCWDRREIDERSTLLAVGIDLCQPEEGCLIRTTRQIAIPGRIPLGATTEGDAGADVDTVAIISTTGEDASQSLERLQARLNRKVSTAHLRSLFFGEPFARQGTGLVLDLLRRNPETRRLQWLAVVDGRAEEVMRARPSLEKVPALFLNDMFDDAVKTGRLPPSHLGEFLSRWAGEGDDPVLPLLKMAGPDRVSLAGLAVFRDDKMVGKLNPDETTTYLQLSGSRRGSDLIRLTLPNGQESDLMVYGRNTRYRLGARDRRVQVNVSIHLEADLFRLSSELDPQDRELLDRLERLAAEDVQKKAEALVAKLQKEWQADILAVGERVRAFLPAMWATIPSWPEAFSQAQFSIDVTVKVRRTGLSAH